MAAARNAVIRLAEREAATRILHPRRGGGGGSLARRHHCLPPPPPPPSSPSSARSRRLPRSAAGVGPAATTASRSLTSSSSSPFGSRSSWTRRIVTSASVSSSSSPRSSILDGPNDASSSPPPTTTTSTTEKKRGDGKGRSPHSKLLRVCSERNANPHFAAIEADMLRLDWHAAMNELVGDWSRRGRFGDFVELEGTVRTYVNNNMPDLEHYERECAKEWQEEGGGLGGIALSDRLRFRLFPYERIVSSAIRHAVSSSAAVVVPPANDDDVEISAANNVREGIARLSKSGSLLDAMTTFDGTRADDDVGWTAEHEACSNCFRLTVSGWVLLHRRFREGNERMLLGSSMSAADVLVSTTKSAVHPDNEAQVWAERWIDFCDVGGGAVRGRGMPGRGILPSDEPLLMGVARVISSASGQHGKHRAKFARLSEKIHMLFSDG